MTTSSKSPINAFLFVFGLLWFAFFGAYLDPKTYATSKIGIPAEAVTLEVEFMVAVLGAYCFFFGLGNVLVALFSDYTAARFLFLAQTAMSIFFVRFHVVITPTTYLFISETYRQMLIKMWGGSAVLGVVVLAYDFYTTVASSTKKESRKST